MFYVLRITLNAWCANFKPIDVHGGQCVCDNNFMFPDTVSARHTCLDQAETSGSLSISHFASVVSLTVSVGKNLATKKCSTYKHLYGPFHILWNGCLWLVSCLKVFEIVVYCAEVKLGRLSRTFTGSLQSASPFHFSTEQYSVR